LKAGLHSAKDTLVVAMHLHLAPVALPLVERQASMAVFLHGIEAWTPLAGLRAWALKHADVLIANSRFTVQQFLAANPEFGHKPTKICPLGVPKCDPSSGQETGAHPFALIVGRLSSLERYKGHDALLGIWHRVVCLHPGARLFVAGDGDDRQRLETKAKELGWGDAVKFLGSVEESALNALYRDCAFFLMPSGREGFGLTFLEAMRAGKACIGATGAAEEIIEHDVTGLIVPPEDQMALLKAVDRLFADSSLRDRMGEAGQERFRSQFTESRFRDRFLTALGLDASR
jgi:glycosyltransferase involved in cell wall biosynthesis